MIVSVRDAAGPARLAFAVLLTVASLASAANAQTAATAAPAATTGGDGAATADDVIGRAIDAYALESRGVVGVRSRSILRVDAPMNHRSTETRAWYVYSDGTLVATSDAPDPRRPPVHDPLRPKFRPEYRFRGEACSDCAAGTVAIGYSSATHDEVHAHGTIVVDTSTYHVLRVTQTPYAFTWPTRDGTIVMTWGASDTGWVPTQIAGRFSGRVGPFSGVAHYEQTLGPYERFATADAAVASLESATHLARVTIATP